MIGLGTEQPFGATDEMEQSMTEPTKAAASKKPAAKKAAATKKAAPKANAQMRETMDVRDAAVLTYLKDHADIGIAETAELLSITSGAAGTCLWRLRGCPVAGVAKKTVHVERADKAGRYKLLVEKPRRTRAKKAAAAAD